MQTVKTGIITPKLRRVVFAGDCRPCPYCDEPVCPICEAHYADCACPGPTQEDLYDYTEIDGVL